MLCNDYVRHVVYVDSVLSSHFISRAGVGNDFAMILLLSIPDEIPLTVFRDEIQSRFPNFLVAARSTQQTNYIGKPVSKALQIQVNTREWNGMEEMMDDVIRDDYVASCDMICICISHHLISSHHHLF